MTTSTVKYSVKNDIETFITSILFAQVEWLSLPVYDHSCWFEMASTLLFESKLRVDGRYTSWESPWKLCLCEATAQMWGKLFVVDTVDSWDC